MAIPIIRIQVDGVRESFQQALAIYNDEFNVMVSDAVDKAFNIDTVQAEIEHQVQIALDDAIKGLSEHYQIKDMIKDIVLKSLTKKRDEIEEEQ
jgi:hypothetical protein